MRVLYIIDSLMGGGAEVSLAHMAPGYRDRGMDLHVAFLKERFGVAERLRSAGATLHPTELDQSRPRQWLALVRLIADLQPDIVHTTLWESDVLGRMAAAVQRRPVVGTFANSNYSDAQLDDPSVNRSKLRAAQLVDLLTARLVVRFHAVSEQVAEDMSERMRIARRRITVVPRARDRDELGEPSAARRAAVRAEMGIPDDRRVVLAIGRQEYQKGLDVLVDAAAILNEESDVCVLVAGRPGRASDDLTQQVSARNLDEVVCFLGTRTDVPDLIVAADAVAVPSRIEGMPGAVLEAMALERPVVASDLPMVVEAIGPDAAALVPVGDPHALAAALDGALRSPDENRTQAARLRFDQQFSPPAIVERIEELYRDAIATSRWRSFQRRRSRQRN